MDGRWLESTELNKAADKLPEARGGLKIRNSSLYWPGLRQMHNEGKLTPEAVEAIMLEEKPNQKERIVLRGERFKDLFPKIPKLPLPVSKREDYVAAAMEHYGRFLKRQERDQER